MRNIRFGLIMIAVCGLIVLAAGIQIGVWAHQAEAMTARRESIGDQLSILQQAMAGFFELESAKRDYLLTGDAPRRAAYDQARRDLAGVLGGFDAAFGDDPLRRSEIAELARFARAAEDEAARVVELDGESRLAAARSTAGGAGGSNPMAAFRPALNTVAEPLRQARATLREQYARKFHDIYVLLALVILVVDLSIIVALVLLSHSIQRLRERQEASESQAMHDPLTQLPNRRYLGEWLETSLAAAGRSGRNLVLLYLDLDGFKSVNDRFGHDIGDRVLQITAGRLRRALRRSDFVARLGGDEFVAVLPDTQSAPGLAVLVERLEAEIGQAPIAEIANDVVSASIGAAWFPTDGATAETLLAAADRAMYDVKQRHRAWRSPRMTPPQSGRGLPQSAMT